MAYNDRKTIVNGADAVTGMADRTYRGVTESVMPKLSNVRAMIDNAERQGFVVSDDLSVSWTRPSGISDASAEKYQKATGQFSQQIKEAATQWWAAEQRVAEQIDRDRGGLRNPFSAAPGSRAHVQTVDHHTFKEDPAPPPGPPGNPFAGWTDEQMAQVATEIAHGHAASKHFPGMSPADVARSIYDTMKDPRTRVGTSIESGGMALLRPDGTVVFINPKDGDYGTVFKPQPRPTDTWRTPLEYFEQHTKALEPISPPAAGRFPPVAPGEIAPPPGASASPPRIEGGPTAGPRLEPVPPRAGIPEPGGGAGSSGPRGGGTGGGGRGGGGILRPYPIPGMPPF